VLLPRWAFGLLVGTCAACLVAVAFLVGRVTAPPLPAADSRAAAAEGRRTAAGDAGASPDAPLAGVPERGEATLPELAPSPASRSGAPAGGDPDAAAVAAYFTRMDAVAAQAKAAQDPQALAQGVLDQALSGNTSGIDGLVATQQALQARVADVLPPPSCREHPQRSLRPIERAIGMLERTRDAVAGKSTLDVATMAAEGRAIEEEARAVDALASDLRRAAGLPPVP
jgi:hypothetical protein